MTPPLICDTDPVTAQDRKELLQDFRRRSPVPPTWHVHIQGKVAEIKRRGLPPPKHRPERRSPIGIWSHCSRMRLLRFLNKVEYPRLDTSIFVTLTYPDWAMTIPYKDRSKQRFLFLRYVEKYLAKKSPCIWRIEWEERQRGEYTGKLAPHFHMMLLGTPFLPHGKIREWWRASIGAPTGPLVTDVREIYGVDGACRYVAKYISKYRSLDLGTYRNSNIQFGRHWGVTRKELIPLCPVLCDRTLSEAEIAFVREYAAARWSRYDPSVGGGYTLLGEQQAKNILAGLKCSGQAP